MGEKKTTEKTNQKNPKLFICFVTAYIWKITVDVRYSNVKQKVYIHVLMSLHICKPFIYLYNEQLIIFFKIFYYLLSNHIPCMIVRCLQKKNISPRTPY